MPFRDSWSIQEHSVLPTYPDEEGAEINPRGSSNSTSDARSVDKCALQ